MMISSVLNMHFPVLPEATLVFCSVYLPKIIVLKYYVLNAEISPCNEIEQVKLSCKYRKQIWVNVMTTCSFSFDPYSSKGETHSCIWTLHKFYSQIMSNTMRNGYSSWVPTHCHILLCTFWKVQPWKYRSKGSHSKID